MDAGRSDVFLLMTTGAKTTETGYVCKVQ